VPNVYTIGVLEPLSCSSWSFSMPCVRRSPGLPYLPRPLIRGFFFVPWGDSTDISPPSSAPPLPLDPYPALRFSPVQLFFCYSFLIIRGPPFFGHGLMHSSFLNNADGAISWIAFFSSSVPRFPPLLYTFLEFFLCNFAETAAARQFVRFSPVDPFLFPPFLVYRFLPNQISRIRPSRRLEVCDGSSCRSM